MSYGSNLLAEHPASYGQPTLPNTNHNARTAFENPYQSDARYAQEATAYPRPSYPQNQNSVANSRRPAPPHQPGASLYEIPEYDQGLNAASNAARPMNGSTTRLPNGQQNYYPPSNIPDNNSQGQPNRTLPQTRTPNQPSFKNPQQQPATRAPLSKEVPRGALNGELNEEVASNQSVSEEAWLDDTKKKSKPNEKPTWPTQQDKPSRSKNTNNKPIGTRSKPITNSVKRDKTYEIQNDPHFDTARDHNTSPTYDSHRSTSFQQPASTRTQLSTNSPHQPSPTGSFKQPKIFQYEPSSPKRVTGTTPNNSSRRQDQPQFSLDGLPFESSQSDLTDRDSIHKNADERFHEALQKLRADRAKQRKELSETTAKRVQYGNYIRNSSTDDLLQSVVKPPSTTDFMELKKGNLLSLSKEEKKQLFDQSRSYGERIRYRNNDIWHENEVAKSLQQNALRKDALQKSEASKLTPRQRMNNGKSKSFNGTLKQHASDLPKKKANPIETKHKDVRDVNQMKTSQKSRTNPPPNRSNSNRSLNDQNLSDYERTGKPSQQQTKKKVRYAKYDSVGREISGIDDDDDDDEEFGTSQPQPIRRLKLRQVSSNLYTLEEERSFDDSRYTKR